MTEVRWTEQAVEDLRSIREFIARDSPRYGRLVAERLFDATSRIEAFPRSGRIVPEIGLEDVRGPPSVLARAEDDRWAPEGFTPMTELLTPDFVDYIESSCE